jgi:hypothetical protein
MTPQSGRVAFLLDGKPLQLADKTDAIDLHCSHQTLLRSIALMPVELTAGDHVLTLELRDSTEHVASPEAGIDFIWVQRK